MGMTGTMKGYGTAARFRAGAVGHRVRDRVIEKRLDRAAHEAERLRLENQLLRDEVEDSRTEHHRILDMLEERMPTNGQEEQANGKSHKARWMLILLALGGGAYAVFRQMRHGDDEWTGSNPDRLASGAAA
jgi:hypothetical protein